VTDLIVLNLEGVYRFTKSVERRNWSPYVGAGPALTFIHQNFEAGRNIDFGNFDFDAGFNILLGMQSRQGPNPAMNAIARIRAATIHPCLRSISGICSSLLGMRWPRSSVHIHTSPDFPPNEAAAADTRINNGPTGFSAPAMQERIPAVR
jgi:hypothetical protein